MKIHPYKKGQTVFDLKTKDYYKIETIREMKLYGSPRIFIKLSGVPGARSEDTWRELNEIRPHSYSRLAQKLCA